jgi:hypothetical protein
MKKLLYITFVCLVVLSASAQTQPEATVTQSSNLPLEVDSTAGQYVDLGLPSGTLWKTENEQDTYYTYDQATDVFGNSLPTANQFLELINTCQWVWLGNGCTVTGPNGKAVFLPAAGFRSCTSASDAQLGVAGDVSEVGAFGFYWSSTPLDATEYPHSFDLANEELSAYCLVLGQGNIMKYSLLRCKGLSVRLVYTPAP